MADKYPDFDALSRNETSGIDYRVLARRAKTAFAVVAPHGGGIEPGTSEIADAIAAAEFSFYTFEGLKPSGNSDFHITSTHFDEPLCQKLIAPSQTVLTIHGEESEVDGEGVFLGGRNQALGRSMGAALIAAGFDARKHPDPDLQGTEAANLCNRGKSRSGVQLELSRAVRKEMFASLTREGRQCTTPKFHAFVDAVRGVLRQASVRASSSAQSGGD